MVLKKEEYICYWKYFQIKTINMRAILTSLLLFVTLFSASAQILEPIRWKVDLKQVASDEYALTFQATIDQGWHLYDMNLPAGGPVPTSIKFETANGLSFLGSVVANKKPITKKDAIFDLMLSWYTDQVTFVQKLTVTDPEKFALKGAIRFMGCNDESCLAPTTIDFAYDQTHISKTKEEPTAPQKNASTITSGGDVKEADSQRVVAVDHSDVMPQENHMENPLWTPVVQELNAFKTSPHHQSWWILLISGFIGGLLALLTPCVWPIIPMTVSFFLKRNSNKKKAIQESVLYGLSIVVIYLALGIGITMLFGASALNSLSTNAFFNLLFFALLVFFAISFFGAFEMVLPASWTNKIDQQADKTSGILSIFFMAFTLVLVSFSCTGPIIGTLLVEAATNGSVVGPAIGMFGFALALAIPFAFFAMFPNVLQRLPKSGGWLKTVKVVLGFLELAFALKFLSVADLAYGWGILPRPVFLVLWILIFTIMGVWLLFKAGKKAYVRVALGLVSLAFSAWMLPGLWGAPLKSISAFAPPATAKQATLYQQQVHAQFTDYELGMKYAATAQKPVLLDFSGFGCVNCRKMENSVWQDPDVKQILENDYVLITLMVDDKTPLDSAYTVTENNRKTTIRTVGDRWSLLQRTKFGANAQPFYVMLTPQGQLLGPSYAYNEDVQAYIDFLKSGLTSFAGNQQKQR